jgi:uncharacterized protein
VPEFEWDETKAEANLEKHGVAFYIAERIFESEVLEELARGGSEQRWKAIGVVEGVEITLIYTWREGRRRIISARRAKRDERRTYYQTYPR